MSTTTEQHTKSIKEAKSIDDALHLAGIDYQLEKRAIYLGSSQLVDNIPVQGPPIPGQYTIVRTDTGQPIGDDEGVTVGARYEVIQNRQAFAVGDGLLESGHSLLEVKSWKGGRRACMSFDLGTFDVGDNDPVQKRLYLKTSHDGSSGIEASMYGYRLVCSNGMMGWRKDRTVKIRHTKSAHDRMDEARRILGLAESYYRWFEEQCRALYNAPCSHETAKTIIDTVFPHPAKGEPSTRIANKQAAVLDAFYHSPGNSGRTLWDLYNGFTYYLDHHPRQTSDEKRFDSNYFGAGASCKDSTFNLLTEMIA